MTKIPEAVVVDTSDGTVWFRRHALSDPFTVEEAERRAADLESAVDPTNRPKFQVFGLVRHETLFDRRWPWHLTVTKTDGSVSHHDYSDEFDAPGFAKHLMEKDDVARVDLSFTLISEP